jgi:hypothetical protein
VPRTADELPGTSAANEDGPPRATRLRDASTHEEAPSATVSSTSPAHRPNVAPSPRNRLDRCPMMSHVSDDSACSPASGGQMKSTRRRRASLPAGLCCAMTSLAPALAVAAIPDADGVIHACYEAHPGNDARLGSLRVLSSADACRRNEVYLTWSQQGPEVPLGPPPDARAPPDRQDLRVPWVRRVSRGSRSRDRPCRRAIPTARSAASSCSLPTPSSSQASRCRRMNRSSPVVERG